MMAILSVRLRPDFDLHLDAVVAELLDTGKNIVFKLFVGRDPHFGAGDPDYIVQRVSR